MDSSIQTESKNDQLLVQDKLNAIDMNATDSDSQLGEEDMGTSSGEDYDLDSVPSATSHGMDLIISGVPYGAVPLAVATSFKARLPYLFERRGIKSHGDSQPLIADFNFGTRAAYPASHHKPKHSQQSLMVSHKQKVILVEDVLSSGESILEAARQLEAQNLKVEFVICIIDREENGANLLLEQAGIHVLSLYKISAILRVLETTNRITSRQFLSTRSWIADNQFKSIGVDPSSRATSEIVTNRSNAVIKSTTTDKLPVMAQI